MAYKALLTKEGFEALPETARSFYRPLDEDSGMYIPDIEEVDGWNLENVAGLKATLSDRTGRHKRAMEQLKKFGDHTPEALQEMLTEMEDLKSKKTRTSKDVEEQITSRTAQLTEKFDGERKTWTDQESELTREVERLLIDSEVARVLGEKDTKGSFKLLIEPIRKHIKIERDADNGRRVARVLDEHGNPKITSKSGSQDLMGIKEFVSTLKKTEEYGRAFDGSGIAGSGAPGSGTTNVTNNGQKIDPNLNPTERMRLARGVPNEHVL